MTSSKPMKVADPLPPDNSEVRAIPTVDTPTLLDLVRAKRAAAWLQVAVYDTNVFSTEAILHVVAVALDDDKPIEERRRELRELAGIHRDCLATYREELAARFVGFRELDARVIAAGGPPAEADDDLADGFIGGLSLGEFMNIIGAAASRVRPWAEDASPGELGPAPAGGRA